MQFPGKTSPSLTQTLWLVKSVLWSTCLTIHPAAVSRVPLLSASLRIHRIGRFPLRNQKKELGKCSGLPCSSIFPSFCSTTLFGMMAFVLIHANSRMQERNHRSKHYHCVQGRKKGEEQPYPYPSLLSGKQKPT